MKSLNCFVAALLFALLLMTGLERGWEPLAVGLFFVSAVLLCAAGLSLDRRSAEGD